MRALWAKFMDDPVWACTSCAMMAIALLVVIASVCGIALATYCTWSFIFDVGVCR